MPAAKLAPRMRAGRTPRAMLMRSVIGAGVYVYQVESRNSDIRLSTDHRLPTESRPVAHVDHLPHHVLGQPRKVLYPGEDIIEGVGLAAMLEALGAAREVREVAARKGRLHLGEARPVEDLHQRMRLQIAEDLIAVGFVAAVRHAAVGQPHHPGE